MYLATAELQIANVAYIQRKVQLSGFCAYPDGSLSQLIWIRGVLQYLDELINKWQKEDERNSTSKKTETVTL